jgi:hypothetical protein
MKRIRNSTLSSNRRFLSATNASKNNIVHKIAFSQATPHGKIPLNQGSNFFLDLLLNIF